MPEHVIKLPDVGEGVAEAELVEWHVKVGDLVREDSILAAVMTDKATVEIPSPVDGEIAWIGAEIGDTVPVGSPIVRIKIGGDVKDAVAAAPEPPIRSAGEKKSSTIAGQNPDNREAEAKSSPQRKEQVQAKPRPGEEADEKAHYPAAPRPAGEKPLASPAVRQRARDAGVDLRQVSGSGPAGRIGHDDLDAFFARGVEPAVIAKLTQRTEVEEIKIVGLRRKIAEKMALSASRIPHITYAEEIDVTALEDLRAALNNEKRAGRPKLTLLPFLMRAMVKALAEQPGINALYDDEAGILRRHAAVHLGIATQTPGGLMVPVVRHAEALDIWGCASEILRLTEAAKSGTASREELSGSTITITSLGAMGGVITTPIINHPEVAIVGVNKIMVRPIWEGTQFIPRKMMNLSSSFDHRVVDGWDAAVFIQRIKTLLETPALIFVEG